jgi:hypothetical protein
MVTTLDVIISHTVRGMETDFTINQASFFILAEGALSMDFPPPRPLPDNSFLGEIGIKVKNDLVRFTEICHPPGI